MVAKKLGKFFYVAIFISRKVRGLWKKQFNNKKQDLLQKKVMYSLLAAGFFCSIGIASTAVAAVASEKVINGDMPSGLETNTEYVNITGGSRITGTFKVINDADN